MEEVGLLVSTKERARPFREPAAGDAGRPLGPCCGRELTSVRAALRDQTFEIAAIALPLAVAAVGVTEFLILDGADDGSILTQADAILHYLARKHPKAHLLDERTLEASAQLDRWGCFLTGDLHPVWCAWRGSTATVRCSA